MPRKTLIKHARLALPMNTGITAPIESLLQPIIDSGGKIVSTQFIANPVERYMTDFHVVYTVAEAEPPKVVSGKPFAYATTK